MDKISSIVKSSLNEISQSNFLLSIRTFIADREETNSKMRYEAIKKEEKLYGQNIPENILKRIERFDKSKNDIKLIMQKNIKINPKILELFKFENKYFGESKVYKKLESTLNLLEDLLERNKEYFIFGDYKDESQRKTFDTIKEEFIKFKQVLEDYKDNIFNNDTIRTFFKKYRVFYGINIYSKIHIKPGTIVKLLDNKYKDYKNIIRYLAILYNIQRASKIYLQKIIFQNKRYGITSVSLSINTSKSYDLDIEQYDNIKINKSFDLHDIKDLVRKDKFVKKILKEYELFKELFDFNKKELFKDNNIINKLVVVLNEISILMKNNMKIFIIQEPIDSLLLFIEKNANKVITYKTFLKFNKVLDNTFTLTMTGNFLDENFHDRDIKIKDLKNGYLDYKKIIKYFDIFYKIYHIVYYYFTTILKININDDAKHKNVLHVRNVYINTLSPERKKNSKDDSYKTWSARVSSIPKISNKEYRTNYKGDDVIKVLKDPLDNYRVIKLQKTPEEAIKSSPKNIDYPIFR